MNGSFYRLVRSVYTTAVTVSDFAVVGSTIRFYSQEANVII